MMRLSARFVQHRLDRGLSCGVVSLVDVHTAIVRADIQTLENMAWDARAVGWTEAGRAVRTLLGRSARRTYRHLVGISRHRRRRRMNFLPTDVVVWVGDRAWTPELDVLCRYILMSTPRFRTLRWIEQNTELTGRRLRYWARRGVIRLESAHGPAAAPQGLLRPLVATAAEPKTWPDP